MKKISLIILALVAVIAVTAYLNMGDKEAKSLSQDNAVIHFKIDGEEVGQVNLEDINKLNSDEFTATLKSSGKDPVDNTYKGIELKALFTYLDLDLADNNQIILKAVDGYTVAIGLNEAMEDENVYVVYEINGKALGKKEDGGSGPYQVIIRQDPFGQRWVKFLMEVELK